MHRKTQIPLFYCTFPLDSAHPGCVQPVRARTAHEAREIMNRRYGRGQWCSLYTEREWTVNQQKRFFAANVRVLEEVAEARTRPEAST